MTEPVKPLFLKVMHGAGWAVWGLAVMGLVAVVFFVARYVVAGIPMDEGRALAAAGMSVIGGLVGLALHGGAYAMWEDSLEKAEKRTRGRRE
jgi:hypothetical protein